MLLTRTCILSVFVLFAALWLLLIYMVFMADPFLHDDVKLFAYTATKDEYLAAYPGLSYPASARTPQTHEKIKNAAKKEPEYSTLRALFTAWPPDDTSRDKWPASPCHPLNPLKPGGVSCALPRFDFSDDADMELALAYRTAELPFVLHR